MKRIITLCALLAAIGCLVMRAGTPSLLVGNLTTIDNTTNNTAATSFGSFVLFPWMNFSITNAGLTATNALTIRGQFSLDGSNWVTVTTWNPSTTNATNIVWSPQPSAQSASYRLQVVTTNSVDLNIISQ